MTKFVAVNGADVIYQLVKGEVESVPAYIVDKDSVGKKTAIFPTCGFITRDPEEGKVDFFQYVVSKPNEEGEAEEVGTSIVFSNGLTDETVAGMGLEFKTDEEGVAYFDMTKDFFVTKLGNLNVSDVYAKLDVPYLKAVDQENSSIFTVPGESEEVGETVVLYSVIELSKDEYAQLSATKALKCGGLSVNINAIVLSFNIDKAIEEFCRSLHDEHAVERVSITIARQVAIQASYELANKIFADLTAVPQPEAEEATEEAPKAEEIQQVADDQDPGEAAN